MVGRTPEIMTVLALTALLGHAGAQDPERKNEREERAPAIAVIAHPDCPVKDLTLAQLRAYFLMDRQFWSDKSRAVLYLRPGKSTEMKILLDVVYDKSNAALRKYWRGRLFRGEIPAKPSVVPSAAAAIQRVQSKRGAFTVVLAKDLPEEGVRVVKIGGKAPGDPDYPLVVTAQ